MYYETSKPMMLSDRASDGFRQAEIGEMETNKVNRVCDAFLDALSTRPVHIQSMITAYVCKQPPDLEAGLSQITKMRSQQSSFAPSGLRWCITDQKSDKVDAMIEHICFLADINRLYDGALGLYDLELTLLIAQQSQKVSMCFNTWLSTWLNYIGSKRVPAISQRVSSYAYAQKKILHWQSSATI